MRVKTYVLAGMLSVLSLTPLVWADQHQNMVAHAHECPRQAKDNITLLLKLTKDKGLSTRSAIGFATVSVEKGNKTAIWLTMESVKLADAKAKPSVENRMLREFISKGGKVYVCPMCAQRFGVKELVEGAELAKPDIIFGLLSEERVRVLSW